MRFKKKYGQHFLRDKNIARKIVSAFLEEISTVEILEIGPGHGVLTGELLKDKEHNLTCIEIDSECVSWLQEQFPHHRNSFITRDFLEYEIKTPVSVIGNFPYNISSQILFKVLDDRENIPLLVGMFQKEVAERLVSAHGSKKYGILSVLLQSLYKGEYLFTVDENVFEPAPMVKSAVVKLIRNNRNISEEEFQGLKYVVKKAFGQRRKMLRNSLAEFVSILPVQFKTKRPEQLSVIEFMEIANICRKKTELLHK